MSGAADGRFLSAALRGVGTLADDIVVAGGRVANGQDSTKTKKPRIPGISVPRIGSPSTQRVTKQETTMTTSTIAPEETQRRLDGELAKFIDAEPTPERKATVLIKAGTIRRELQKMAPMLRDLDDALQDEIMTDYFGDGDAELKRVVFNVLAGSEEIPLTKRNDPGVGETALAKMLDELQSPESRSQMLIKIGALQTELRAGLVVLEGKPEEERQAAIKAWVDAADTPLRKNILDAEMSREGRRIYGTGVQADQVVSQTAGNASTHVGAELKGSETNSDSRIARTIPRAPTGEGAGARVGNSVMPSGKGGESTNPGSGPNDTGGGEVRPATLIRRSGATGGLGNSQGADTTGKSMKTGNDATAGNDADADDKTGKKKKKAWKAGDKDWDDAKKAELAGELVKSAPGPLLDVLGELEEDDQMEVLSLAAHHGADLIAWSGIADPTKLAKRDLDSAIAAWLTADPDTLDLKKWVAEALTTSEDIPLDLGKAIMAWKPPPAVRAAA